MGSSHWSAATSSPANFPNTRWHGDTDQHCPGLHLSSKHAVQAMNVVNVLRVFQPNHGRSVSMKRVMTHCKLNRHMAASAHAASKSAGQLSHLLRM